MQVDFRVLGPVEVWCGGVALYFPRRQQRLILGILAIDVGHVAPVDRLIDLLWSERPPAQARAVVHTRISEIRAILSTAEQSGSERTAVLARQDNGYVLRVDSERVDAHRFRRLIDLARVSDSDEHAREALQAAIQLWRGPALGGWLSRDSHSALCHGLESARVTALEDLFETELRLGRHRDVVDTILEACTANPHRERLTALAMLALHQTARTPEALQAYERYRTWAEEELGIDPGQQLQEIYLSILRSETNLIGDARASVAASGRTWTESTTSGIRSLDNGTEAFQVGAPNTLPSDIPDFTGREDEAAHLMELLTLSRTGVPTAAVAGPPGVGKTALSIHVAHRLRNHFAEGQLYADLHGVEWEHPPTPAELLARFLRALGVQIPIPDAIDERIDMYRGLLADRRILIVLDNAASADQVLPLIPGSATCGVLVNSRTRLGAALGVETIDLNILDESQAISLLSRIAGENRVESEPAAAAQLVHLCGGLPLAVRVAAAKLAAKPHWQVKQIVDRLSDENSRLDHFVHEHLNVRSSIAFSYLGLTPAAQRLLRRLGDIDNPEVNVWSAAALLDAHPAEAEEVLEQLHDAQLVDIAGREANGYARYRLHDLVRLFTAERAAADENPHELDAARTRVLGAWLFFVEEVQHLAVGGSYMNIRSEAPRWSIDREFVAGVAADPLRWFDNERFAIVHMIRRAGKEGRSNLSWGLAVASSPLFQMRSYYDDWPIVLDIAYSAATQAGDDLGRAAVLHRMGTLSADHLAHEQARSQFEAARELFERLGEQYGQAIVTAHIAVLDRFTGRQMEALAGLYEALPGLRDAGDRIGEAFMLRNIGQVHMECGDHAHADDYFARALDMARHSGSRRTEAQVYLWQGMLRQKQGRFEDAEQLLNRVLAVTHALGDQGGQAQALRGLGLCYKAQGRIAAAYAVLSQALPLVSQPRPTRIEAMVREELAHLADELGDDPCTTQI